MLNALSINVFRSSVPGMPPFLSHSVALTTWSRISNVAFGAPGNPFWEQKGNFRYLWVKKSWNFYLSLSLLPSFFFFLIQCFWSWEFIWPHFRGKRFGELETYGIRRKEVQVGSGGFSSPFSAQRLTYFFVFLSGLLDLIVRAFYFIFSFILLFCHPK